MTVWAVLVEQYIVDGGKTIPGWKDGVEDLLILLLGGLCCGRFWFRRWRHRGRVSRLLRAHSQRASL